MSRRPLLLAVPTLVTAVLAVGCGDQSTPPAAATPNPELRGAEAQAPPPSAAGALVQIPESDASQRRLAYANLERLDEVTDVLDRDELLRRVLESGARRVDGFPDGAAATAVQVGGATVLRGPGVGAAAEEGSDRSGGDGVVLGADAEQARDLADVRPVDNLTSAFATSSVQSCLGDPVVEVIVGTEVLGRDAALGVALRASEDPPAGVQLVVCYAPRFVREIDAADARVDERYGDLAEGARAPVIGELELGERELFSAVLPADRLPAAELAELLMAGPALLALVNRE